MHRPIRSGDRDKTMTRASICLFLVLRLDMTSPREWTNRAAVKTAFGYDCLLPVDQSNRCPGYSASRIV